MGGKSTTSGCSQRNADSPSPPRLHLPAQPFNGRGLLPRRQRVLDFPQAQRLRGEGEEKRCHVVCVRPRARLAAPSAPLLWRPLPCSPLGCRLPREGRGVQACWACPASSSLPNAFWQRGALSSSVQPSSDGSMEQERLEELVSSCYENKSVPMLTPASITRATNNYLTT